MKLKENAFLWLLTGFGTVALALAIYAEREPTGFYVAVRAVVCFASAYAGVRAYRAKREVWTWLLGANTALYNPFIPVHLTREIWSVIALFDIALLATAAIVLRAREARSGHFNEPSTATPPNTPAKPTKERKYRTASRTELALWFTVLLLVLAGVFLSQYYNYIYGATTQTAAQNTTVGGATLGLAFWAYVIARASRWRRPGRIALLSFLVGLATLFAGSMAGGYTEGVEMKEALASIKRFDPALAARMKAGVGVEGVPLSTMMKHSLVRAVEQAPDTAVVKFMAERFAIIQGNKSVALERCVAAFKGRGNFHPNDHEQLQMMRSLGNLYSAAAAAHRPSPTTAERRAEVAALSAIFKKIDPDGILNDQKRMNASSEQQECDIYTRLMHELQLVPPKEGAAAIRAMMGS